jgi:phosphate-selective porin OprO/OprP
MRVSVSSCTRFLLSASLLLWAGMAAAEDAPLTPREKELLQKLDVVLQRLDTVEQELAALKAQQATAPAPSAAPAPAPGAPPASGEEGFLAIEDRIAALEKERESTLAAMWKDGLRLESKDGQFKLQLGGRAFVDYGWITQDDELRDTVFDEQSGGELRDVRLDLKGDIYSDLFYRVEYQFSGNNGPNGFTDTYVGLKNIPYLGTATFGHFKEPFGLEELTSDSLVTFMERSMASTFNPARNLGLQFNNAFLGEPKKERLTYAIGAFENTDNWPSANDADEDQGAAITGRVTGLPWYVEDGRKLLHLGAAYSHRNPDGAVRNPYQLRPFFETRKTQFRWLDTEGFAGFRLGDARPDDVDLYGVEAALVYGPFSLQGEYTLDEIETTFGGDLSFGGYYVQASYFITGEHRPYKNATGVFDRVHPEKNFGWGKGPGAWELAARYSSVDLNDRGVRGGEANTLTLGVNWYLNPSVRLMLNYTIADIEHDVYDGELGILQTRFQVDF